MKASGDPCQLGNRVYVCRDDRKVVINSVDDLSRHRVDEQRFLLAGFHSASPQRKKEGLLNTVEVNPIFLSQLLSLFLTHMQRFSLSAPRTLCVVAEELMIHACRVFP